MMVTVYFDTSFYVHLERAQAAASKDAIDRLHGVGCRPALSPIHVKELLRGRRDDATCQRLLQRVLSIHDAPLLLDNPRLDALLAPETERVKFAQHLEATSTQLAEAEAYASVGRSSKLSRQLDLSHFPAEPIPGLNLATGQVDEAQLISFFNALFQSFGSPIRIPDDASLADAAQFILSRLPEVYGDDAVSQVRLSNSVFDAVATDSRRTFSVIHGQASADILQAVTSDRLDAEHMAVFRRHKPSIDYFQLDGRQLRRTSAEGHPLRTEGLLERCFQARSLEEAVVAVEQFAATRQ